jgi:hypothetical protein
MRSRPLLLLSALLFAAGALACAWHPSPKPHAPGGPYYFERFIHPFPSFYPTLPHREIPEAQAKSRPVWFEAYFNDQGQVERMVKFRNGQPAFDLRYHYAPDGSYEREEFAPLPTASTQQ